MSIMNQSWLYKNDTRKYPLWDDSPVAPDAIVDCSVSIPDSLAPLTSRVYIDEIIASPNVAVVGISLEGYLNADGNSRIAQAVIQDPMPYRLYPLSSGDPQIFGFVVLGSAVLEGRSPYTAAALTVTEGRLLDSVVMRYPLGTSTGFEIDGVQLTGDVTFIGESGVNAAVETVSFPDGPHPALVLRLDRNITTMLAPVAPCDMPTEAGTRTDLVTSINGVTPRTGGDITLLLESRFDFQYTEDGDIKVDPVTKEPLYDLSRPLVKMVDGPLGELCLIDNFDYKVLCAEKKRKLTVNPSENLCNNCTSQDAKEAAGLDMNDGLPIEASGSAIWGNKLCVYWGFSAQGTPVYGDNPLDIDITLVGPLPDVPPIKVIGTLRIVGAPPNFPGDLIPGTLTPSKAGSLGAPVYTVYLLDRPATKGETYTLKGLHSIVKNTPPTSPEKYPTYHSSPFEDSCSRFARDPESSPTPEFEGL